MFPYGGATLLAVLLLLIFVALFFLLMWRWRAGRLAEIPLRKLPAIEQLRAFLHRAAEMGESVHLSPGVGSLHDRGTAAETLAGLQVVQEVSREALALGVPVHVTTDDAVVNVFAERLLESSWEQAGRPPGLQAETLLVAQQQPIAYAAGAMAAVGDPQVQHNVMVGAFGEEVLLIGEVGVRSTSMQVVGAARSTSAALLPLISDNFLLGEEIFAAGAYLSGRPARVVSVLIQDILRAIVMVLILVGVIFSTLGVILPNLRLDRVLSLLFQMSVR